MNAAWLRRFRNNVVSGSSNDGVCSLCRDLSHTSNGEGKFKVKIAVPSLKRQKGANGCPYCRLVKDVFDHYQGYSEPTITLEGEAGKPTVMKFDGYDEHYQLWYLLYKPDDTVIPSWPGLGGSEPSSAHLGSDASLQFIQQSLIGCINCSKSTHSACIQDEKRPLPMRAIDVRNDALKLVIADGEHGEYTTLSYRWGPPEHAFRLTTANLDELTKKVEWSRLPRLLQDAITVTRWLGISYFWIDALCILQDDIQDWEAEAPKMGLYYKHAVLTIAASSAGDVRQPFLLPREKVEESTRPKFEFRNKDGTTSTLIARRVPDYAGMSIVANSPLSTRGWTWQENVLSTRIVHFTKTEIIWECRSEQKFENGAAIRTSTGLAYRFASAKENIEHYWKTLVTDYSKRDLTYESDRLPAISGAASELKSLIFNGQYMAGVWKQWIFSDLLWKTSWGEENRYPPMTRGLEEMPSWSWASIVGQVFYEFQACEQSEKRTPRSANPFGLVKQNASLVLEGLLFPASLLAENVLVLGSYMILVDNKKLNVLNVSPDTVILDKASTCQDPELRPGNTQQAHRMRSDEVVRLTKNTLNAPVFCFYLGGGRYSRGPDRNFPSLTNFVSTHYYLILSQITDQNSKPNSFNRLGLFTMSDGPPWKAKRTRIMLL